MLAVRHGSCTRRIASHQRCLGLVFPYSSIKRGNETSFHIIKYNCQYSVYRNIIARYSEAVQSTEKSKDKIKGVLKGGSRKDQIPNDTLAATRTEHTHLMHSVNMKGKHNEDTQSAIEITKLGAVVNTFLALSKGISGYTVGSTALIADAINSLSDLLCDAVVFLSVTEARKAATPDQPWGRGKLEPLGSLMVSGLLFGTGIGIGYSALLVFLNSYLLSLPPAQQLGLLSDVVHYLSFDGALLTEGIPHSGVNPSNITSMMTTSALAVSSISVVAKELLYRYTLKAGERANSAAVIANAWQHRSDAAISSAVFLGLTFSAMGYSLMDPFMGVLVSIFVVKQAFITGRDSLRDLSDAPTSQEETEALKRTCMKVSGILSVNSLLARRSGPYIFVECIVGVKGMISASAAHRLAELVRLALLQEHAGRVANAVVHVLPLGSAGMGDAYPSAARDQDHIANEVTAAVLSLPDIMAVSEFQVYYKDDGRIAVKVDVVMNPDLTIRAAHALAVKAREAVEKVYPHIAAVDVDLELDDAVNIPSPMVQMKTHSTIVVER